MPMQEHPIVAVATPLAPAALAVIRTSGADVLNLIASRFSRPQALRLAAGHTLVHGHLTDREQHPIDEVLVSVFRAPRSYTGEEAAEISCHGSPAGVRRVYQELLSIGLIPAQPGEFTRRAFANGKLDLTQAEAVDEIVRAQTAAAHALAVDRLGGAVREALSRTRQRLISLMAQLSIQLDYPEEDTGEVAIDRTVLTAALEEITSLAATFSRGRLYQEGVRVALAGRTNAGKSSLFNRLLGNDRSIVSEVHGTTRDYLEALIDLAGVPVRLFDTAGLRTTSEQVEEEGIRRSRQIIEGADLVLYVRDATCPPDAEDEARVARISRQTPVLVVDNKIDLAAGPRESAGPEESAPGRSGVLATLAVSATTGEGVSLLLDALRESLLSARGVGEAGGLAIDSQRQFDALERAAQALRLTDASTAEGLPADVVAVDLQEALAAIGEITGEVATAEILDQMFGSFCVGK